MKNIKRSIQTHWRLLLIILAGLGLLFLLLWFRLGSLTYGEAADIEVATKQAGGSWRAIIDNPLNAPYTVMQRLVVATGRDGITSLRLISTVFAVAAMVLFYFVAREWHSTRVALLATWLFISSSWYLHVSRLASPEVLWLVSVLALIVVLTPNRNGRQTSWALPSVLLVLSLLLYIPGMVWLVIPGVIWQHKNISEAWQATSAAWLRLLSVLGSLLVLAPLGWALYRSPELIRPWLALSEQLQPVMTMARQFISVPENLLVRSFFEPARWLGNLPILSSFEIIMLALGLFFYASHVRAARTRLIALLMLIAWVLIAVGGVATITLLIPVVYLLVTAGIAYILREWLKVFPNNPIARFIGIGVILVAILLTSVYQTRSYFVAWRYNEQTYSAFHTRL